ncbi:MAG: hypothetical protein R3C15_12810 [Thermoleophilia bacterium]
MAAVSERGRPGRLPLPVGPTPFLGAILLVPALLGLSRLLPETGAGLALRLAAAGALVLLVPGALVLRSLGWPGRLGVALAGALAWSLVAIGVGLLLTVAAGGSLTLTLVIAFALAGGALVPALWQARTELARADVLSVAGLALAGLALGAAVWWTQRQVSGDGLFHLARARKLAELPALDGLESLDEFADGGLHPGYAFPLWHAALALIAKVGGVDVAQVVLHLPSLLVPLALVVAYGAGSALLGSWGGGIAAAGAQAALVAFPRDGVGVLPLLSLPATTSRILLVPAVLALAFHYLEDGRRRLLVSLGAAGLVLAIVHPTYVLFVCLPLGGFLVARAVLVGRAGIPDAKRLGLVLAAILAPAAAFLAWLLPVIRDTEAVRQTPAERAEDFAHYAGQVAGTASSFHVAPDAIGRGGAAVVAGLLVLPLLVLAARSRWAAFVLGGALVVLAVLLIPFVFTHVSDVVSLSQSRRLIGFLPLPFALAGAAVLGARLGLLGAALAVVAGVVLQLAFPGSFGYASAGPGPGWAVWIGLAGGLGALALGRLWPWPVVRDRREGEPEAEPPLRLRRLAPGGLAVWTAVVGLAFTAPIAVDGLRRIEKEPVDKRALSAGLVRALREQVPPGQVVLADLEASYRIGAYAPVYVVAAPPAHVARTKANRPLVRRAAIVAFFFRPSSTDAERWRIANRYGADWLVVDRTRRRQHVDGFLEYLGEPRFQDRRYALYRIPQELRS